jgi:hydroxymethylpyrimidine/phosphomethylpyrimidine kinase
MCRLDYLPLCTIAGSDPTGGAGLQADLRVFAAHGCHGSAVPTALTVQDRSGVHSVTAVDPALVRAQVDVVLADLRPAVLKIGMLATRMNLEAVANALDLSGAPPLVLDPVLAAGAGGALLDADAVAALAPRLAPHTTLLTPNLPEAARLLGRALIAPGQEEACAEALRAQGWRAVLLKGGHGSGDTLRDVLVTPDGAWTFSHPRIPGGPFHGTGCTLSSAIAARLARGESLPDAVAHATAWLQRLLRKSAALGSWLLPHLSVPCEEPEA